MCTSVREVEYEHQRVTGWSTNRCLNDDDSSPQMHGTAFQQEEAEVPKERGTSELEQGDRLKQLTGQLNGFVGVLLLDEERARWWNRRLRCSN